MMGFPLNIPGFVVILSDNCLSIITNTLFKFKQKT
jgi:hypothetical protein